MKGGKLMKAGYSTTPSGERLADADIPIQWGHINWKTVDRGVNKLQTRIAKAVRLKPNRCPIQKGL
jgi:trehalose utilization protein